MAWKTWESIPGRGNRLSSSSKCPKWLLDPQSPISMDIWHYFPGGKVPGV